MSKTCSICLMSMAAVAMYRSVLFVAPCVIVGMKVAVFDSVLLNVIIPHACQQVPPAEHLAIACHRTILELCRSVPKEVSCYDQHDIK